MSFPVVGVIAPELAVSQITEAGNRLGIQVKGSRKKMSALELTNFAEDCNLICIEPELISIGAIKVAEQSGAQIYPSSKLLTAINSIELHQVVEDKLAITAARSAHAQSAIWPIALGELRTDPNSDDYRPYLHLMARNPKLKFDQRLRAVGLAGGNLEALITEIIHAQQYYSGEIDS
ncbi:MAG: hypothetical protein EBS18_01875 [Actinobacteria bacterium]|nr:hypothetical protein [Actinomycetota bacterium]